MEYRIGPHRLVVEDDVVFSHSDQAVTGEEMQRLLDICTSVRARWGRLYVVTIMGPGFDMTPGARKVASDWGRQQGMTHNIVVGASLAMRTLLSLISRAHKLLGARQDAMEFAATEAEARSLVAKHKAAQAPVPVVPHP